MSSEDNISLNSDISLLTFVKEQMVLQSNFQPIVIKSLLESPNYKLSYDEIKERLSELNFDREDFEINQAITSVKKALINIIQIEKNSWSLNPKQFDMSEITSILQICGQKIAKWHNEKILNREPILWRIKPGREDDDNNFPWTEEFLESNTIGIGWKELGDLTKFKSEKEIFSYIDSIDSEATKNSVADIRLRINKKDFVLCTKAQKEIVDFGIVTSDYIFESNSSYNHRRKVIWLNQGPLKKEDLPEGILGGSRSSLHEVTKPKNQLLELLTGESTKVKIPKTGNYYLITQQPESEYDDIEGKQYAYDSHKQNFKKFLPGTNFIIQSLIDKKYYFIGFGKVGELNKSEPFVPDGKKRKMVSIVARFSHYTKFSEKKDRPKEIFNELQAIAFKNTGYGSQFPSMLEISEELFNKILGEDLTTNSSSENMLEDIDKIYSILKLKKNVILYGPPGTGKTFTTTKIAESFVSSIRRHTWRSIAALVLLENGGQPLNYHEIASKALEKNLVETSGETPHETIAKEMRNDMNEKGGGSYFIKPEDGIYGLKIPTTFSKAAEIILFAKNQPMHSDTITKIALENNMINQNDPPGITPERSMNQVLSQDTSNQGNDSIFIKTGDGIYDLRKKNPLSNKPDITSNPQIKFVTFHPSYSYEDFVEGIRPIISKSTDLENEKSEKIGYALEPGIFKNICENAEKDKDNDYLLIIDEINRGNISKIFGELITLIEDDKRSSHHLELAYSKESFTVPENLYILGTMNTADKSLVQLDSALRRRFAFVELMPKYNLKGMDFQIDVMIDGTTTKKSLSELLEKLNKILKNKKLRDKQIGHSYFLNINKLEDLQFTFQYEVIPLLQDYFYDNYERLSEVLGDMIIDTKNMEINNDVINNNEKFSQALGQIFKKDE